MCKKRRFRQMAWFWFTVGSSYFFCSYRFCLLLNTGRSDIFDFFAQKNSTDMPWSVRPTGSCKMQGAHFFLWPPLGESLNNVEKNEGLLSLVGRHKFRSWAFEKKKMVTVVSMIPNIHAFFD